MDALTAAMPATNDSSLRSTESRLPRWPIVLFPAVVLAAVGFAFVLAVNRTIVPWTLGVTASAGLGLISGFTARWTMRPRAGLVRDIAALSALTIGLLLLGMITWGNAGIRPIDRSTFGPDWSGLGQVGVGALTAWLALQAWQARPRPRAETPRDVPVAPAGPARATARPSRRQGASLRGWPRRIRRWARAEWRSSPVRSGLIRTAGWLRRTAAWAASLAPDLQAPRPSESGPSSSPRPVTRMWRAFRRPRRRPTAARRSIIRLGAEAQHCCPYCLDAVEQNDPRGVQVCPVCHTPHHADCWAVTGRCQVPHLNS